MCFNFSPPIPEKFIIPNFWRHLCIYFFNNWVCFNLNHQLKSQLLWLLGGWLLPYFVGTSPRPLFDSPTVGVGSEVSPLLKHQRSRRPKSAKPPPTWPLNGLMSSTRCPWRFHPKRRGVWIRADLGGKSSPKRPRTSEINDFGYGPVAGFTSFFLGGNSRNISDEACTKSW